MSQSDDVTSSDLITFQKIGIFRSCFLTKNGTPRQPSVCPYARGSLKITCFNNPEHSLERLSEFSHVWLIFLFHENGRNVPKAKVAPPRLNGKKVGVFASRSPHRPNNIGMSLVKLERIQNDTLHFTGIDIIDGTPIIDIKPYIPYCDTPLTVPLNPEWITNPSPLSSLSVSFTDTALQQISQFKYVEDKQELVSSKRQKRDKSNFRFMRNGDELRQCISDIIRGDPRSVYRKKEEYLVFSFPVDTVDVKVEVKGQGVVVLDISCSDFVRNLLNKVQGG